METHSIYREKIANAIASLVGEETLINDVSITKVINTLMPVVKEASGRSYDIGRAHQVSGGTKTEFMDKYFPEDGNS